MAAARAAFVVGADHAFIAATLFVGATVLVLAVAIRGRRAVARAAAGADVPEWVRDIGQNEDTAVAEGVAVNG